MTVYNKLKIAILAIISSQSISAIILDPIQIQSGSGDLLYAEMKFSHADPNAKIEVGLAEADDLMSMGISHQPPGHLNFFTRRSGDGSGVIVITSSRPIIESELNILLKIKEGSATRIQQIKTPLVRNRTTPDVVKASNVEKALKPQIVVSEKDIQLNLPTSTQYAVNNNATTNNNNAKSGDKPLTISVSAPPALSSTAPKTQASNSASSQASKNINQSKINAQVQQTTQATANVTQQETAPAIDIKAMQNSITKTIPINKEATHQDASESDQNALKTKQKTSDSQTINKTSKQQVQAAQDKKSNTQQHVVQANESLWKIASRIAAETKQSIPEVMKQIRSNNQFAFIQGDPNRIRQGAALNIAASYHAVPAQKQNSALSSAPVQKQSGKAKYRLNQAEMSLVADNDQVSAQGSAKKDSSQNQTSSELSSKVMTAREKTVKLQQNVSQLVSALQQKDHRIQLLNARLAQLEQQLKQQNQANKPTH